MNDVVSTANIRNSSFVAIDFETANHSHASICSAGMAVFDDGILAESPYWLIRPPKPHEWFHKRNIACHGLTQLDVLDSPEFSVIATEFLDRLARCDLVIAHNAGFDISCLRQTLDHFGIAHPEFAYVCTLQLSRRVWKGLANHKLGTLMRHIGHDFNHHHAQSDAEAAGRVLLAMMQQMKVITPSELLEKAGMKEHQF